jgi:hypothetical protein
MSPMVPRADAAPPEEPDAGCAFNGGQAFDVPVSQRSDEPGEARELIASNPVLLRPSR